MKIIFLGEAGSIHTIRWVNSLSEKGIEVILVSLKGNFDNVEKISKKVKTIYLPFGTKLGYYLNIFALKRIISKEKPDLINAHYASGYGTLGRLSGFNKKLLNVWGSDVYDFPNESKLKKRIIEKNLKNYTAIASTSYCMAEETKKYLENKSKEIFITPFGVDTEKFKNLNIEKKENKITVGIVKTLTEKYGIEYLIKAIKELENILDNEDVPKALNEMDIFVVPSILNSESFGVVAVEAMACEVPVIVSDVDGLKEVVVNNETGFVVPKRSSKEIANKIKILIENSDTVKKFKKNARERVLKLYDWNKNVDNMIKIYEELLK